MPFTPAGSFYSIAGQGFPLVLLHGVGMTHEMWDRQVEGLSRRFRVVTYDLLGHGQSPKPRGPYPFADFVSQLRELSDHIGLERFGLAGFSFGGMVARAAAIAMPERIAALAVLNSPHARTDAERADIRKRLEQVRESGPAATVDVALQRWFTPEHAANHPEDLALVRRWVLANDKDGYASAYERLVEGDAELAEPIRKIACPSLFMSCEHDYGNSPAMVEKMAGLVRNARLVIVPRLRHMGLFEDPTPFNAALLDFFGATLPLSAGDRQAGSEHA
jgi:pimeloyl-ACP methyl ester carboxylesterase